MGRTPGPRAFVRAFALAAAAAAAVAGCLLAAPTLRAGDELSLEDRARVEGWIVLLEDEDADVRGQAETELAKFGERARALLEGARKAARPEARRRIDAVLQRIADARRTSAPDEWQGLRGGPQRSGVVGGSIPRAVPALVWEAVVPDPDPMQGALAATSDCVVSLSADGVVRCFEAADGTRRWLSALGSPVTASAAIAGGRIVVPTGAGITALSAGEGHLVWTIANEYGANAAPAIVGARAYVALRNRGVLGVDLRTGETFLDRKIAPQGALLGDADLLVTAAEDGALRSLDPATGRDRWKVALPGAPVMGPTLAAPGVIVVFTRDGGLQALRAADGKAMWRVRTGAHSASESISAAAGRVFLPDGSGFLHAFDAATGRELWNRSEGMIEMGAPAATATAVCFGTRGRLGCRDAATGDFLWRIDVEQRQCSSPIVAAGRVFVLDAGRIRCLR